MSLFNNCVELFNENIHYSNNVLDQDIKCKITANNQNQIELEDTQNIIKPLESEEDCNDDFNDYDEDCNDDCNDTYEYSSGDYALVCLHRVKEYENIYILKKM